MLPVTALPAFRTIAFNHETAPPTWEKNKEHSQNESYSAEKQEIKKIQSNCNSRRKDSQRNVQMEKKITEKEVMIYLIGLVGKLLNKRKYELILNSRN